MAMTGGTAKLVSSGTPPNWPEAVKLYVYYKEKSQSVTNNTTTLSLGMYVTTRTNYGIGGWTDWNGSYIGTATSGDNCKAFNGNIPNFSGTRWLIENQDITVTHNNDGTKTATIYWHWGVNSGWNGVMNNPSGSFTITLTTIPRASSFTVSNASVDMDTAVTFNITRASTAFTHKLTYAFEGKTGTIGSDIATSKSWTIPLSLAAAIPNKTSGTATITLTTYNGSTAIGTKTLTMTLKVPSSVVPTISSVTITEATSGLASKFSAYIQNKSTLKVVISASGVQSSTVKSYSTKILGKTYTGSTITSGVITISGSVSVVVTVTDSRGRTNTKTENVTVLAYADPKITAFTAQRCNKDGTANDDGEYVKLAIAFNITSLNSKNDKSYTISYKSNGGTNLTTLISGSVYSLNTTYISTETFDIDNSYEFILTVTDYFRTSENPIAQMADISTSFTLVDYHSSGSGMAIGKASEKSNTLEIALDVEFMGKVRGTIFDAIYPVGSIYMSYNHVNPGELFGGTWTRIENAFLWASTASDTIGVTGGERTHTLTVNEMPRHKHNVGAYKSTDGAGSVLDSYTALVGTSNGADTTSKYYTSGTLSTGSSQPHNNMPPYIHVSVWRRTA